MISDLWKYHKTSIALFLCSGFLYYYIGYSLERTNTNALVSAYAIVFICFLGLLKLPLKHFITLAGIAIILRMIFIAATPNLSQDFYRFIWDGRMVISGWNPYLYLPDDLIASGTAPIAEAQALQNGMGSLSAGHYTNYPPINQLCFTIAGWFSPNSIPGAVIVLRILIILADIGTLIIGKKLLKALGLPVQNIFLYILNPFIIIELSGNLHFEGVMILFLIWSLYLLYKGNWIWAAILLALSISVKLIPLMLLPLFFQWFIKSKNISNTVSFWKNFRQLAFFYSIIGLTIVLTFLPFLSAELISNYQATVGLWFQKFEFNASLYYVTRWIGYQIVGWNTIETIGTTTPFLVLGFIGMITFFRDNSSYQKMITAMLFALSFYLFTATTVHPWYVAALLLLSIFTKYRFPLIWSFVIILSYSAYTIEGFKENLGLVAIQYTIIYGFLFWELFIKKNPTTLKSKP